MLAVLHLMKNYTLPVSNQICLEGTPAFYRHFARLSYSVLSGSTGPLRGHLSYTDNLVGFPGSPFKTSLTVLSVSFCFILVTTLLIFTKVNCDEPYNVETRRYSAWSLTDLPDIPAEAVEVYIWNSTFRSLPAKTFAHLAACKQFQMRNNYIPVIESGAFKGMNSLLILKLSRNKITTIKTGALSGLNNLEQIWIWGNAILSIETLAFIGTSSFRHLYLFYNHINTIQIRAFTWVNRTSTLLVWPNHTINIEDDASNAHHIKGIVVSKFIHKVSVPV